MEHFACKLKSSTRMIQDYPTFPPPAVTGCESLTFYIRFENQHNLHASRHAHVLAREFTRASSGDLEPSLNQNGGRRECLCASTFHNETEAVRVKFYNFWTYSCHENYTRLLWVIFVSQYVFKLRSSLWYIVGPSWSCSDQLEPWGTHSGSHFHLVKFKAMLSFYSLTYYFNLSFNYY